MTVQMITSLLIWCKNTGVDKVWVEITSGQMMKFENGSRPIDFNGSRWELFHVN